MIPGNVWAIARFGSDRGEDDVVFAMPSILLETGKEQVVPKSKRVDREDSPTISNSGAGDPRGGVMKRPAAPLRYAVNGPRKTTALQSDVNTGSAPSCERAQQISE